MALSYTQVDAFTDTPFAGNPAAIYVLDQALPDEVMQRIANEHNLSETAFVVRQGSGLAGSPWPLRWFTPLVEVMLCGHATLAAAHAIFEREPVRQRIVFDTQSGLLTVTRADQGLRLEMPATVPVPLETDLEDWEQALGVRPVAVYDVGVDRLAELADAHAVRHCVPDESRLRDLSQRGICVTSLGDSPACDFVSRFFAPSVGIREDPVTGSAHCYLVAFWGQRLGRSSLTAQQLSPRGGTLRGEWAADRVALTGQAVSTLRGECLVI